MQARCVRGRVGSQWLRRSPHPGPGSLLMNTMVSSSRSGSVARSPCSSVTSPCRSPTAYVTGPTSAAKRSPSLIVIYDAPWPPLLWQPEHSIHRAACSAQWPRLPDGHGARVATAPRRHAARAGTTHPVTLFQTGRWITRHPDPRYYHDVRPFTTASAAGGLCRVADVARWLRPMTAASCTCPAPHRRWPPGSDGRRCLRQCVRRPFQAPGKPPSSHSQ